ncbi:GNAT family N-acetyltransferase [Flavihumibacter sp. ZG627]|uniref:GNAT family N-acetyltransferase n=1 Tax=Flavihumibacter sp. ZG627 TaxID=1463156 RepID=UPI0005827DD8|nr:GNAT family N-acetyltransferase [Flavihumibacter sp. ZG627]KIC90311.1 hypothetical protein HY58_10090 [Flavihumibacter sp. ZG627]
MAEAGNIKLVKRKQLDTVKWEQCISFASNGLIYARHYYLDIMCNRWDALVMGDYEAVMPLPWKSKMGIRYMYQPPFVQQAGVFYLKEDKDVVGAFLLRAKELFPFGEINLNFRNNIPNASSRNNFILDLHKPYEHLRINYRNDLLRNLGHQETDDLKYTIPENYHSIAIMYQQLYAGRMSYGKQAYEDLHRLCSKLAESGQLIARIATLNGNMVAGCICFRDEKRIYLIASATPEEGRKLSANHFLIDAIIKEFADTDLILDFEGSDLPGVAHFYQNFGAMNQPYYFTGWNRLTWPLSMLKPSYDQFAVTDL